MLLSHTCAAASSCAFSCRSGWALSLLQMALFLCIHVCIKALMLLYMHMIIPLISIFFFWVMIYVLHFLMHALPLFL